jgi:molybdate transport system ATP-binding protein
VAYGLRDTPRRARRAGALRMLERFGADGLADARPSELSGGERQRVALARALARRPAALLLDEPLSALDPRTRGSARHVLGDLLREAAVPAIVVTHDFTEAAMLAERVAVLDGGRVLQEGPAADLASSPASAFVADFTGASVLDGIAGPGPGGLTAVELGGGACVLSTDVASGPVTAIVRPWEVVLEPPDAVGADEPAGSALNRLPCRVVAVTPLGNRLRVGLALPQPLSAEVTTPASERLGLKPGARVVVSWKATATRLVAR